MFSTTRLAAAAAATCLMLGVTTPEASAAATGSVTADPATDPVTSAVRSGAGLVCTTAAGSLGGGATLAGHSATDDPVVSVARGASGDMWQLTTNGEVLATGVSYGSAASYGLAGSFVAMATTPDGRGYWLVTSTGRVFPFGDAHFYGSMHGRHLNAPIVGAAATADGRGYWLVASDGGVFSFGDAKFYGSTGATKLQQPVVALAASRDNHGYRLVTSDGAVITFGDAKSWGSEAGTPAAARVTAIVTSAAGGYWLVSSTGSVEAYGTSALAGCGDAGSAYATRPASVVVAGDSITVASSADLTADLVASSTTASFVDHVGWTLEDGTSGLAAASSTRPGAVVVAFGTNDWFDGASSSGIAAYQTSVRKVLASLPAGERVVWVLPYWSVLRSPITAYDTGIQGDLDRLDVATAQTLGSYANVQVLDMNQVFDGRAGLVGPDGLHPSTAGAEAWAGAVAAVVEG